MAGDKEGFFGGRAPGRASKREAPSSKNQAPKKSQTSSTKHQYEQSRNVWRAGLRMFEVWCLVLGASLVLGAWCLMFFRIISPRVFVPETTLPPASPHPCRRHERNQACRRLYRQQAGRWRK